MDPASAATVAAAKQREGELFIKEVWGLTGTAIVFVFLRYYARLKAVGIKGLTADDYLMFPATVIMSIESMAGYMVVAWWKGFANNGISDPDRATLMQKASLDPKGPAAEEVRLRIGGSKNHVLGLLMYTTLMWLLKGCWALYYNRLTNGVRNRRLLIKGTILVLPATYIGCLLVAFLKCMPFDHHWQIFPNPGANCMPAISPLQTIFVMVMNTVTDFYLMAIPIPMIWKSKLPLKKKFMIILMFSGATLEMVFGILRAVAILKDGDTNPAESGYWSIRESFVSFVLTNLPMVYPLFREYFNKLRGKTDSMATGKSTGNSYQLSSYPPRRSRNKSNNNTGDGRNHDPHIIPNETITSNSRENITCTSTLENLVTRGCKVGGDSSSMNLVQDEIKTGAPGCCRRCHMNLEVGRRDYPPSFGLSNSQSMPFNLPQQQDSSSNHITITTEYMVTDGGRNKAPPGSDYAF